MSKLSLSEINRLALPAIVAGVAEPLIGLVDTAIIGHLGTVELAGVGIASSLMMLLIWILAQTKSAISAIFSKYYGNNRLEVVSSLVPQAILFNICLGFATAVLSLNLLEPVFSFYGAKGLVLDHAISYYGIRVWGIPIMLCVFGLFGVFRGLQNTKWAMQISIIGGLVNLVLDFILVYGIPGFIPSLGVEGAAYASVISQILMLILVVRTLYKRTQFRLNIVLKLNPEFRNMVIMSLNFFLRTIALNTAYFLGTKFTTSYGVEYIAAHTIAMNIWLFSAFFIDGYSGAGNALAGKYNGMGDYNALYKLGKTIMLFGLGIGSVLGVVYLLGYSIIGNLFTNESAVLDVFYSVFWLVILIQPLNGLAFGIDGVFKGLGEAKFLRNTLLISTLLVFIPTIFGLDYLGFGIQGVWWAFNFWMISRFLILFIKFRKQYRQFQ